MNLTFEGNPETATDAKCNGLVSDGYYLSQADYTAALGSTLVTRWFQIKVLALTYKTSYGLVPRYLLDYLLIQIVLAGMYFPGETFGHTTLCEIRGMETRMSHFSTAASAL